MRDACGGRRWTAVLGRSALAETEGPWCEEEQERYSDQVELYTVLGAQLESGHMRTLAAVAGIAGLAVAVELVGLDAMCSMRQVALLAE